MMTLITINNISKKIAGTLILENVTAKIEPLQRIGIIGRNGEGKTTLLNLLAQKEPITSGEIFWQKSLTLGVSTQIVSMEQTASAYQFLVEQFHDLFLLGERLKLAEQKLADNPSEQDLLHYGNLQEQFIQAGGYDIETRINKITQGLGVFNVLQQTFDTLSGGQKTRLALCRALLRSPDVLLLDEPTNHLDLNAIDWLSSFLRRYRGTIIVVSHDRYFLDDICSQIWEIEDKAVTIFQTNFSGYQKQKEALLLQQFASYKNQQKQIQKMETAIKQMREWAKQADNESMFKRAKNMERALERIVRIKRPNLSPKTMGLNISAGKRSGKEVFKLTNAWKFFDDKPILIDASLQINFGERVAIMGNNGSGKTSLLKILLEQLPLDDGTIVKGQNLQYAYLSQELEELNPNHTIIEAFRDKVMVSESEARHLLATFLFYGYDVFKKVKDLSGGELMRLRLAWFIEHKVNTLLLDEPTNHLDIASREVLENILANFQGTIILISHDRYFINTICNRILWLNNGNITSTINSFSAIID